MWGVGTYPEARYSLAWRKHVLGLVVEIACVQLQSAPRSRRYITHARYSVHIDMLSVFVKHPALGVMYPSATAVFYVLGHLFAILLWSS